LTKTNELLAPDCSVFKKESTLLRKIFSTRGCWSALPRILALMGLTVMSSFTPVKSEDGGAAASAKLGEIAQKVLVDIFRKRDVSTIDRYFAAQFVQHDPNMADGLSGMKAFVSELAASPATDITIYRILIDDERVLLHSRYEGIKNAPASSIAFDLFRFKYGKIVEHWGGQEPQSSARNLSGHTQVDGPTAVEDRDKTEVNRTLVQTYRNVITVQQHYDRIGEFLADNYIQHAVGVGDGIERLKARFASVVKPGALPTLVPRFYLADGNFVLSLVEAHTDPPTANFDLFRIADADAKIAEHWEVLSPIPPRDQWKNSNGPF
jgi:predicted SnoaL-like aldol condensation-catalyzing enzyme